MRVSLLAVAALAVLFVSAAADPVRRRLRRRRRRDFKIAGLAHHAARPVTIRP